VSLFTERAVEVTAEVADRATGSPRRSARKPGDLDILDPLVRQLTGDSRTSKVVGVEHDFPTRAGSVGCLHHPDADSPDRRLCGLGRGKGDVVFAAARHQR
jgi:hypothetical protein